MRLTCVRSSLPAIHISDYLSRDGTPQASSVRQRPACAAELADPAHACASDPLMIFEHGFQHAPPPVK